MYTALLLGLLHASAAQAGAWPDDSAHARAAARAEPIAAVRVDADRDGQPDRLGDTVTIAGRASSNSSTLNRDYTFLFVQDASAGIALFSHESFPEVATGDSIIATGMVHQYRGLSQLLLTDLRIVRGPRVPIEPVVVRHTETDLESLEGQLVRFDGWIKGIEAIEGGRVALVGAESSLDGIAVYVSDAHSLPPEMKSLRVGDEVTLTGLLAQHDIEPPYDESYQVFPRSPADLRVTGLSGAQVEVVLKWGGALLLMVILWLLLTRVQVWRRTRELRATAHRFQALIENAYEIITVLDARGRVTFSSQGLERLLGWKAEERAGRSVFEILHPDDVDHVRRAFAKVAAGPDGASQAIEFRARRQDGEWRTISSIVQNRLRDPATAGVVVNSRDVTDQQALEQQLLQTRKLEAIGRVAGGIAHDFNNLMTVVRGHAEMLLEGPRDERALATGLEEIREASDRAAGLTAQLLAFSRKQVLRPRVVDLTDVLRRMEALLRRLIGEDIAMEFHVAEDIGRVSADPTQVEQVLMNLAVNARDAMPQGGTLVVALENATIDARQHRTRAYDVPAGDYVVLSVRDSGSGIEPDILEHIFEPFFTTKGEGRGTGLGLATVYGIVKQSGGYIWVDSDSTGTCFHIYLPRTDGVAEPERNAAETATAPTTGGTVLLIEDERALRSMTQRILEREGYRVLTAGDGVEALEFLRDTTQPIDLVLTDVVMPRMGGREVGEQVAVLRPETRLLFMSGYTDDEMIQRGVMADGRNFLAKPFSPAQLLERVASLIRDPALAGES